MSSQMTSNSEFPHFHPFPFQRSWEGWLFPAPATPGFYGSPGSKTLVVTGNNKKDLGLLRSVLLKNTDGAIIISLDTGGVPDLPASSFRIFKLSELVRIFEQYNLKSSINQIYLTHHVAQSLGLSDGSSFENIRVKVFSSKVVAFSQTNDNEDKHNNNKPNYLISRILYVLRLWCGQCLVFALPMVIFDLRVLGIGLLSLLISSLFLAVGWIIIPGINWVKGVIVGLFLDLILVGVMYSFNDQPFSLGFLMGYIGLLLSSIWMSNVIPGIRDK